jgi:hypothetical protein
LYHNHSKVFFFLKQNRNFKTARFEYPDRSQKKSKTQRFTVPSLCGFFPPNCILLRAKHKQTHTHTVSLHMHTSRIAAAEAAGDKRKRTAAEAAGDKR